MSVDEAVRSGDLDRALQEQTQAVKARPADMEARAKLVQILVLAGQLDRAETHLLTMAQQDASLQMGAAVFRGLLAAEEERRRVFAGSAEPNTAPEVPPSLRDRIDALAAQTKGRDADAATLLERARGAETPVAGTADGVAFASLADGDEWLGPVLEVFAGGRYLWIPLQRLQSLEFKPPRGALDLVWRPVSLQERDGTDAQVHVPVLYAGTSEHADGLVRAGRKTEWKDILGVGFRGAGPRVLLATGSEDGAERELPLLSLQSIEFTGIEFTGSRA